MVAVPGSVVDVAFDDDLETLPRRSIDQPSVPLPQRPATSETFQTGIKVIDVLAPLERGGKAGSSVVPGSARPC